MARQRKHLMALMLVSAVGLSNSAVWGQQAMPQGAVLRLGVASEDRQQAAKWPGVYRIVFSPDGKTLATRGADQSIRLWDAASGKQRFVLLGHQARVLDVVFSPDGKRLASAGWGENIRLWDTANGRETQRVKGGASTLRFSPDGKTLSAADEGKIVRIKLPAGDRGETTSLKFPLAFSPDGRLLAGMTNRGAALIVVVEVANRRQKAALASVSADPVGVTISPDGKWLAAGGRREHQIKVWNIASGGEPKMILKEHTAPVQSLAFSPDGRFLASASWDKTVRIWEMTTGREVASLEGHAEHVCAVAFSPDGGRLASGASGPTDNSVLIWDVSQVTAVAALAAEKIDAAALEKLWQELADKDARLAHQAIGSLRQVPDKALPLLAERLEPILAATNTEEILKLIKQLNDDKFALREGATNQLKKLRPAADPLLEKTLSEGPSPEVGVRIRTILSSPLPTNTVDPTEQLRAQRIVYLLKLTGTKAARALLERISTNFPDQQVSRQAVAALAAMGGE